MKTSLVSAADRRYGWWLLNLIGSVHASSPGTFDEIVIYDLGLSPRQRRLVEWTRGVEVRTVPEFTPRWREGFTWKTWILRHVDTDRLVWLDAGVSVLRPLGDMLTEIDERGYWVVSQGHPLAEVVPSDYYAHYGLPPAVGRLPVIAGGILGFARPGRFFDEVIVPSYEDALRGLTLGFSADEVEFLNYALNYTTEPVIRDALRFRHDQTVLNLRFRAAYDDPVVADGDRWAGRSDHEHPEQVIWAHRRSGDLRFLTRLPFRMPAALVAYPVVLFVRARWWLRLHRWLFRPSLYLRKGRELAAWGRKPAR